MNLPHSTGSPSPQTLYHLTEATDQAEVRPRPAHSPPLPLPPVPIEEPGPERAGSMGMMCELLLPEVHATHSIGLSSPSHTLGLCEN